MQNEYLRWPAVQRMSQLSRSTAWRLERDGKFPQRRQLSANAVGWLESDITEWINSRPLAGGTAAQAAKCKGVA